METGDNKRQKPVNTEQDYFHSLKLARRSPTRAKDREWPLGEQPVPRMASASVPTGKESLSSLDRLYLFLSKL